MSSLRGWIMGPSPTGESAEAEAPSPLPLPLPSSADPGWWESYEGAEKRLEVDFELARAPTQSRAGKFDMRRLLSRAQIEELLALSKCDIISEMSNEFCDAYVLSESSLFVSARKIMLKTCGRTTPLSSLSFLLDLAAAGFAEDFQDSRNKHSVRYSASSGKDDSPVGASLAGTNKVSEDEETAGDSGESLLSAVLLSNGMSQKEESLVDPGRGAASGRKSVNGKLSQKARPALVMYSRKRFLFPDLQPEEHRTWDAEVRQLQELLGGCGKGFCLGPTDGEHWNVFVAHPAAAAAGGTAETGDVQPAPAGALSEVTMELMMHHIDAEVAKSFYRHNHPQHNSSHDKIGALCQEAGMLMCLEHLDERSPHLHSSSEACADCRSREDLQIVLDEYHFEPCGYSMNGLFSCARHMQASGSCAKHDCGHGHCTIHVTPEEDFSYASFEVSLSLPVPASDAAESGANSDTLVAEALRSSLPSLCESVLGLFSPKLTTVSLFCESAEKPELVAAAVDAFAARARALHVADLGLLLSETQVRVSSSAKRPVGGGRGGEASNTYDCRAFACTLERGDVGNPCERPP